MEKFENNTHINIDTLKKLLNNAGIDTSLWGKGESKTLIHLQKEIENGESILITTETGELLRKIEVATACIYYQSPDGKKYRLKEEKQIFKDGRERRRNFIEAVSEKIKQSEDPYSAMIRGIKEELGINNEINLTEIELEEKIIISSSYPGLKSQHICHKFQAMLTDEQFKPEGYIEKQPDKTTYFIWEEIK